ncbi:hypothetical protein GCM10009101_03610 [Brevundimonas lenta]
MQAGRQHEMAFAQGAGVAEFGEDIFSLHTLRLVPGPVRRNRGRHAAVLPNAVVWGLVAGSDGRR